MINDRSKAIPEAPKNSRKLETLKVLASKETTLFSDRGSNVWMPIERNSQIKAESNLASFGNDSGLLVKTPDELVIGIKGNSKITISKANDGIITVTPSYGCFGLRSDKAAGSDVNITFLSGVKRIKVLPKSVFCKNKPYEELFESKVDEVFIDKDVNTAKQLKLKNIFPCRDVVEVDDQSGSTASVLLKFLAPLMTNKTVLVSTNPDFTDTIFTAKTFLTEAKTNPLGKGRYFWRVKNESDGEISEVCHFDVVYHGDINLNMPKNDDVVIDNSIEFSWNKISGANKYTVAISKDLKNAVPISGGDLLKTVHRMETETNSVKLDDPMQTLGPGSYYWSVETKTGKVSPYRRFFVYTGNDIVMESPKYEDVFKPSDKFFLISWNPLPMVKSYSVVISSNPSFVSSDYVNTTTQPFVYIESLKEGKYYLKVSAIFNNDAKIVTDVIPFNVLDIPEVVILDLSLIHI